MEAIVDLTALFRFIFEITYCSKAQLVAVKCTNLKKLIAAVFRAPCVGRGAERTQEQFFHRLGTESEQSLSKFKVEKRNFAVVFFFFFFEGADSEFIDEFTDDRGRHLKLNLIP